ncbi:hypothetical protein CIL05_07820 [Virgibacillus profundi]|uniref:Uncharacterized protein n=1 Tax=Virgibacillus profundi TaxID=2024555 RepID=A0A2A2IGU9_9BACI|nr:hypothetical protein [Virgibacillus profundi]PAV30370.1 hypothetical protein CIL05_07820 [Virgibacillus profundi]PXY54542.1 hypothetical protein CIT14_07905 [Virgibacillus profundi]
MLKFDNISIELNYETLELAKNKVDPILIDDESDVDSAVGLTLDQAKWLRDNIDYIIKRFED